jgi:hypothetical protein
MGRGAPPTHLSAVDLARFEELAALEPRLAGLLRDARRADTGEASFCANAAFSGTAGYRGFKPRITELVGWRAGMPAPWPSELPDPDAEQEAVPGLSMDEQTALHQAVPVELCSQEAYELVYRIVLQSLPPCRKCGCVADEDADLSS